MGRVAVVTGAASGIGRGVAERLAARGDRVGLLDLREDVVDGAAANVADRESVDAALARGPQGSRRGRDRGHVRRHREVRALHRHRARDVGAHPHGQPHGHLPLRAFARRLLLLSYSFVTVSFPIEVWRQPHVLDCRTCRLDLEIEPVP